MPSSPITTEAQTSQLEVTVPVSSPIDCYYDDGGDASYQDNSSYLSSSSSSEESEASLSSFVPSNSSSCPTNNSFSSSYTSFNIMNEDNIREHVRNSLTSNSISTAALSDILCDHYVQTQTMDDPFSPSSSTTSDDNAIDVPLETFRIFEGPSHAFDDWFIGQPPLLDDNKEWTLVETTSKPTRYLPKQEDDDDEGEDPSTTTTKKDKRQSRSSSVKTDSTRTPLFYTRDTRANTDYLRMIVAEVNMMRAQKIVGPLRPRRVLPKRTDRFMFRPSPLQLVLV
jgi:hypothetical protein